MAAVLLAGLLAPAVPHVQAQAQGEQGLQGGWAVDDAGNPVFYHSVADQLPLMRQAGAGWVRINFRLGACYSDWTSTGCNGRTALQAYDEVITRALGQNLRVLGLLSNESWPGGQDQWIANNAEVDDGNGDNAYARAFAEDAAGVVARHFAGRVGWWEIWNEPNAWTARDGAGNPTGGTFLYPSNFAWLMKRSHAAVKAARADAVVVAGGLLAHDQGGATFFVRGADGKPGLEVRHGERVGPRRTARTAGFADASPACQESRPSGAAYLCDMYVMGLVEAGWSLGPLPLDHVALHFYLDQGGVTSVAKLTAYLDEIRAVQTAYEGRTTPKRVEMTEGGWTTAFVSEAVQAQNVGLMYQALRGTSYVGRGYWFMVQDIPEAGLFHGLADGDGRPKAAFAAYQQAVTGAPPGPPAPTLTATPLPTPTATPLPAVNCTPRPAVAVQSVAGGDGRLRVTVSATGANNWLTAIRFTQTPNAIVEVPGQSGRTGAFTLNLPGRPTTAQFSVRRFGSGPVTVHLIALDRCGEWPTFVGGGGSAGF